MADVRVEIMSWGEAQKAAAAIRFEIFLEPDSPPGMEADERDSEAVHALAYDEKGKPVGTGRLMPDGQIGRLAVLKDWRRRGVAAALLSALIAEAGKRGYQDVSLDVPLQAAEFYRDQGFVAEGKVFQLEGSLHQKMRKPLAGS